MTRTDRNGDDAETVALVTDLRAWFAANEPDVADSLRPGATATRIHAYEERFNLVFPPAPRALFLTTDGQRSDPFPDPFVDNFTLIDLEASLHTKDELDGMIGTDFEDPDHWRRDWVPFAENGGGDYLAVDATTGRVIWFWHDEPTNRAKASDLNAWLRGVLVQARAGERETEE